MGFMTFISKQVLNAALERHTVSACFQVLMPTSGKMAIEAYPNEMDWKLISFTLEISESF